MNSYNRLHIKISSSAIAIVLISISILAIVIFYFASKEIKDEYERRLNTPVQLIQNKVVGYEVINNREFIKSLIGEDIIQCVIIGMNGKIYYSVSKSLIGKDSWDIKELNSINENGGKRKLKDKIGDKINSFTHKSELINKDGELSGYLFIKTKNTNFKKEILKLFSFFIIGLLLIMLLIYLFISSLIKKNISSHLAKILQSSKELNQGNLSFVLKEFNSKDELEILERHYNSFVKGLREKTKFAIEIEKKNFDYDFTPLSEKDELGKALTELRNSLKKATEEEVLRKKSDEISNWITNGVARFSEILRNDIENIEQLGYSVISNLVEYLDANQGGFFLIEEDERNKEKIIELKAAYALNRKKHYQKTLAWGEGLIGSCILEGKTSYLTNLPDEYINISSGLGESKPKALLIVPLSAGDIQYGAIEIATFKEFKEHHLKFVERISEIIASTISTVKNNIQTQKLLKETQEQSERIRQAEEELRQNIEEMHATQEEVERTNKQLKENEEALKQQTDELAKEKALMDALMDNIPDYIYFKDKDSKFLKNSRSHARVFGSEDPKYIIGKSDFDFFSEEHSRPAFEDEQNIIKTGKPIIDQIEKEVHEDGRVTWVSTTKMPLRNVDGNIIGTFGISKDITPVKQLEQDAVKVKDDLEFENILFTTLMDNIAARITYKDTEAKYLRINKTKQKALGIKDQSEVFGKTDLDIFGDTHSAEILNREIENIKNGQLDLSNKELIKYKDGRLSWGSTSRIPLLGKENEIVGGLVITWDITEKENAILELGMYKEMLESVFNELLVIYYRIDKDNKIEEISGKGLKIINLKTQKEAKEKYFKIFPELITLLKKQEGCEIIDHSGDVKIDNRKIEVKHNIFPHRMTTQGYTGFTIIHEK